MILLAAVLSILVVASLGFFAACAWQTWSYFRTPAVPTGDFCPPVTIMVPAKGTDPVTIENWRAFCVQDYPDYEVLFGVSDAQDSAVPDLERLVAEHPGRARLFAGLPPRGANYKDSILDDLLAHARHDVLVFADSDIRAKPDYLRQAVAALRDPQVGLTTAVYVARWPRSFGTAIASLGRCCDFIPAFLLGRRLDGGLKYAIGVTMATRRSTLAQAGGLHLNRIGSDYNLGKRVAALGTRVELLPEALDWETDPEQLSSVLQREIRWARTIRFNRGNQYFSMIFCYGGVYALPLILIPGMPDWAVTTGIVAWVARLTQAVIAIAAVRAPGLLPWLWTLPIRDVLTFGVWVVGAAGRHVWWAGRCLRLEGDGVVSEKVALRTANRP